jgi:hypothetical protein
VTANELPPVLSATIVAYPLYHIVCPHCKEPIPLPQSGTGWCLWTASQILELPFAECIACEKISVMPQLPDDNA